MTKREFISFFGNQDKAAAAINVTSGAISQWGEYPPMLRQYQIQAVTKGKLKVSSQDANKSA